MHSVEVLDASSVHHSFLAFFSPTLWGFCYTLPPHLYKTSDLQEGGVDNKSMPAFLKSDTNRRRGSDTFITGIFFLSFFFQSIVTLKTAYFKSFSFSFSVLDGKKKEGGRGLEKKGLYFNGIESYCLILGYI
ncbi:hypothetical protein CEXT_47691 [Caerostris extrusa]|uniref:Transmembrane protein n=1 Tax=Caerostris extrusa TaxID=172846 RepID=A0AAV4W2Y8_CAEEX|nr:hypothetical protein CEXT_47691 [Caerostris extrusa]